MKHQWPEHAALEKLLSSYHLDRPLPPEIRKYIAGSMGRNYRSLLRSTGQYTLLAGLYLAIYFFIKKNGVILAILKCLIGASVVAAVSYASYRVYEVYAGAGPGLVNEKPAISIGKPQERPYAGPAAKKIIPSAFAMGHFAGENFSEEILIKIEKIFLDEIRRVRGIDSISMKGGSASFSILGTVESYGGSQAVFIKVMKNSDKSIVFSSKQSFRDLEGLEQAAVVLAGKIAGEVR